MPKSKKSKPAQSSKKPSEFRYGPPPSLEELGTLEAWMDDHAEDKDARAPSLPFADGLLTGLALYPSMIPARDLFEKYFGPRYLADDEETAKMRKLILRRYEDLKKQLSHSKILDPYLIFYSEDESDKGKDDKLTDYTKEQAIEAISPFIFGFINASDKLMGLKIWTDKADLALSDMMALCPECWKMLENFPDQVKEFKQLNAKLQTELKSSPDVMLRLASDIGILGEEINGWPLNECLDDSDFVEEDESH